jgi:hypothetical protein
MKLRIMFSAVTAAFAPAAADAMPVDVFLAKAQTLQSKGMLAMFSGDVKVLLDTIKADAAALRGERETAVAAHRTPPYCPPGPVNMDQKEIFAAMQAVPAPERSRTDTRTALRTHLARRFPCPASR